VLSWGHSTIFAFRALIFYLDCIRRNNCGHGPNEKKNTISLYFRLVSYLCACFFFTWRFAAGMVAVVFHHRKIRLIEGKAKCHLNKSTCYWTLRQVFICLRPRTPYLSPLLPYILFTCTEYTCSILIHTGKVVNVGEWNQKED
jgi:hypothetical protein